MGHKPLDDWGKSSGANQNQGIKSHCLVEYNHPGHRRTANYYDTKMLHYYIISTLFCAPRLLFGGDVPGDSTCWGRCGRQLDAPTTNQSAFKVCC